MNTFSPLTLPLRDLLLTEQNFLHATRAGPSPSKDDWRPRLVKEFCGGRSTWSYESIRSPTHPHPSRLANRNGRNPASWMKSVEVNEPAQRAAKLRELLAEQNFLHATRAGPSPSKEVGVRDS